MANPFRQTITSTGEADPWYANYRSGPFNTSIAVVVPAGTTANYSVEYTFDELFDNDPSACDWLVDPQFPLGTTASAVGNYIVPVGGVRVNVASISGGPIRVTILQGDGGRT